MTARKCIAPLVFCTLFFATAAWANGYDDALRHVKNAQAFLDAKDYVITSYSIHYTKLYEATRRPSARAIARSSALSASGLRLNVT